MDFWFVAVSALLIFTLDSVKSSENHNITIHNLSTTTTTTATTPTPQTCPPVVTLSSALHLGFLTVEWGSNCNGRVILTQSDPSATKYVCFSSKDRVLDLLSGVCERKKGCKGKEKEGREQNKKGLQISGNEANEITCETLNVTCEVEVVQEPVGFRVATALLCLTLILLLLIYFSKPTIKALQKRLSNKRKNRWIGPTQSHSVSYQRGQTVNKNLDGQKHSSYPALDRLVVGNTPSNRNSYNF
ncbi:uncharacterized protein LOC117378524 [Periophthalmus magnuspinnatus]|uniref:uncharacterized protein LOC117378524 n=1 Tax=Periophthalmus magnuspinnatus TaxID=409849 RepID=UPI00145AD663|nr:uncharacterized protein LOC117378524 [Periophthalmus magnuspinnatus]